MKASGTLLLCGSLAILTGACSVPKDLGEGIGYAIQDAEQSTLLIASHTRTLLRSELSRTEEEGQRMLAFLETLQPEPEDPELLSRLELLERWSESEIGEEHPALLSEIFEAAESDPRWPDLDGLETAGFHLLGFVHGLGSLPDEDGLDALGTEIVRWHADEALVQGFDRERDRARLECFVAELQDLQSAADIDARWRQVASPDHSSWITEVLESAEADPHWRNADPAEVDHAFAFRSAIQRFLAGWPPEH